MFTTGQWVFAALFFIAFVILVTLSYKKDGRLHKKQYKGSRWILLGFIGFVVLLFLIKYLLKE